jgi:histone H3/H4
METDEASIGDKLLPMSSVNKIVKSAVPEGTSISKDAKKAMQMASTVFVMYISTIAGEVSRETQGKKKKPIVSPEHIVQALEEMEFRNVGQNLDKPEKKK